MLSGKRLTKIQATTSLDCLWPKIWIGMSKAVKKKKKQNALKRHQSSATLED